MDIWLINISKPEFSIFSSQISSSPDFPYFTKWYDPSFFHSDQKPGISSLTHPPLFLDVNVTSLEHPPPAIVFLKSIIVAGTALFFSIALSTTYIIL